MKCGTKASGPIKKLFDGSHHMVKLIGGEFRVNWEGKHFVGRLFGDRKIPFSIAQLLVTFLQVQGNRIVDTIADPLFG